MYVSTYLTSASPEFFTLLVRLLVFFFFDNTYNLKLQGVLEMRPMPCSGLKEAPNDDEVLYDYTYTLVCNIGRYLVSTCPMTV